MILTYSDFRTSSDETLNLLHALTACRNQKATCLQFENDTYYFDGASAPKVSLCMANHGENGLKRTAFLLDKMENFEIDGNGSHFVFDSVLNIVTALKCKNIVFRNFTVSMPICPYPEGKVIAAGENYFDVNFNYHSELIAENDDLLIPNEGRNERAICNIEFNGKTHEIESGTDDNTAGAPLYSLRKEKIAPNTIRFFDSPRIPIVGNVLALMIGRRYASGFFLEKCENVAFYNIKIHSCVGIGVMAQCCHNITLRDCSVTAEKGKYISSGADATHFVACTGSIVIEDCLFEHMLDDAVNVHGVYVKIVKAEEGKATIRFCNSATTGIELFEKGDKLCQMDQKSLIPRDVVTVSSVCKVNNEIFELSFEEPIKLTDGFVLENLTTYPELELKRCLIQNNRARGILIATRNRCVIEDCVFHTGGSAIVLECDASFWYESGAMMDLVVKNNRFNQCKHAGWGNGIVFIPAREEMLKENYYHGRIEISNNIFDSCCDDALYANNIRELIYQDNLSNEVQILHLDHIGNKTIQSNAKTI